MTPEQTKRLFSPDLNLSPEARTIVVYVDQLEDETDIDGWVEIEQPTIMRLLQVKDRRKAVRALVEAANAGWVEYVAQTGKGHNPKLRFKGAENGSLSDSIAKNESLNGDSVAKNVGVNGPSSTASTTTSTAPARDDDWAWAELQKMLAPFEEVLGDFDRSAAGLSWPMWPEKVFTQFRPPMSTTDRGGPEYASTFQGRDRETVAHAMANALTDYAQKEPAFTVRRFRAFVRSAVQEIERAGQNGNGSGNGSNGGSRGIRKGLDEFHAYVTDDMR